MIKKLLALEIITLITLACPDDAQAEDDFVAWQSSNIQFLHGYTYELGEREQSIVTLEHSHEHKYGDTFAFVDVIFPDGGDTTYYGEISPRVSLGKVMSYDLSLGIIKDVLVSTTFEKPEHAGPVYLYGGAFDFNIPAFTFLTANVYIRDDTQLKGDTWHVKFAWNVPFDIVGMKCVVEGFSDIVGAEGAGKVEQQLIVPNVLVDVGDLTGYQSGKLWAGFEYSYWNNKFGVDGVTESVMQAQIKLNF